MKRDPNDVGAIVQGVGYTLLVLSVLGYAAAAVVAIIMFVLDYPLPAGAIGITLCLFLISVGIVIVGRGIEHWQDMRG